jgi:hypothetical protein
VYKYEGFQGFSLRDKLLRQNVACAELLGTAVPLIVPAHVHGGQILQKSSDH